MHTSPLPARTSRFRLPPLSALRPYLVFILLWPVAGLVISAASWFVMLRNLDHERRAIESQTLASTALIAQNQAAQTKRNLAMVDQILMLIRVHWQAMDGQIGLEQFRKMSDPAGVPLNISVFGADAALRMTNAAGVWTRAELRQAGDLPFFSVQRLRAADDMFIGMPRPDEDRTAFTVRFSRKLLDRDGEFAGVAVVSLDTDALVAEYDPALLGRHGFIAAVGNDGVIRAFKVGETFRQLATLPTTLRQAIAAPQGSAFMDGAGFGDGSDRYVSWQAVDGFPLVVLAGADQEAVLGLFRAREQASRQVAASASLGMLVFVLAGMAMSVRLALQRHRLTLDQDVYRKATEASTEGFFITAPVFGNDGRVVDYITVDCNRQGAALVNRTRDELVSKRISSLGRDLPTGTALTLLGQAMASGCAEGDLDFPGKDGPRHVRVQARRSGDVLAVTLRDVTLEKAHLARLERKNYEDVLTGLPNRAWVGKCLPDAVARAAQRGTLLAVLFVDLDGFKAVNDTFGHAAGDELLQIVSRRLKVAVRPGDHVARLGGDEFIVVLENLHDMAEAAQVAARVVQSFQSGCHTAAGTATVGTSVGISICPGDAHDVDTLLRHADIAMYEVKTSGKNRYQFFDPAFYGAIRQRQQREQELRTAIDKNEFVMHYQVRVDTATREVASVEALVRWNHPTEGQLPPDQFIPLAEETGLIVALGERIVDSVCAQIAAWAREGHPPVPVSINVSSRQFNERDIHALFLRALERHAIAPEWVEIELTESAMIQDPTRTSANLHQLHALGIRLLVDDFGTGYSSLSMLQQLDFDILKVDKSFTSRLGVDCQAEILFAAIITMAHALGMKVVAEGVERSEQLEALARLRCDELQGYHIASPLAADRVQAEIRRRRVAAA